MRLIRRIEKSPAYRVAYKDSDFIDLDEARGARLQLEMLKPDVRLYEQGIRSTIVVFGGTRIVERHEAEAKVKKLERRLERRPNDRALKRDLRIAKAIRSKSRYYNEARKFGRLVSEEGQGNHLHDYVVVTGGGPGIMEAANRGAFDVDAKTIGMNITLPMEQYPNPYITPELCFQFHYFALRKMHFLKRAKALVAFPGGYGTLDELFEALTLVQTLKVDPLPIVLFGEKFWRKLINFEFLVEQGTIDPSDIELFVYADKAVDAWNYINSFYEAKDEVDA